MKRGLIGTEYVINIDVIISRNEPGQFIKRRKLCAIMKCTSLKRINGGSIMNITQLSIELAKDVFQLYGVDGKQKCVWIKRITSRTKLIEFLSRLKACEIYGGL
jgi:hypothetical protein